MNKIKLIGICIFIVLVILLGIGIFTGIEYSTPLMYKDKFNLLGKLGLTIFFLVNLVAWIIFFFKVVLVEIINNK